MTQRLIHHLRANVIAYAALFIALGGTSYAAVSLPKNSVGTTQLRKGAVTLEKLAGSDFGGRILAITELENNGAVLKSVPRNVRSSNWTVGSGGLILYPRRIPRNCFPIATPTQPELSTSAGVPQVSAGMDGLSAVQVSEDGPTQLTVTITCLQ